MAVILGGGVEAVKAASLDGSASIEGENDITIGLDTIQFDFSDESSAVVSTTGSFTQLSPSVLSVTDLMFEQTSIGYVSTNPTVSIDFGPQTIDSVTDNLTFTIDAPIQVVLSGGNYVSENPLLGVFSHGGIDTSGTGSLMTQAVPTGSPTYSMTLSTVSAVPEPLTLLGSGAALAMGVWLKLK